MATGTWFGAEVHVVEAGWRPEAAPLSKRIWTLLKYVLAMKKREYH